MVTLNQESTEDIHNLPCINEAWLRIVENVYNFGMNSQPRHMKIKEILGAQTFINMQKPILTVKKRDLGYQFLFAEAYWILTGDNRVNTINKYSPVIHKFSDDGHRFQGAYGPMIMEQIRYIIESLEQDRDSRQAVLTIWRQNPRPSKDIPCTVAGQWFIRENSLLYNHTMRSSDLWLGYPYDVFNFACLTNYIRLLLIDRGVLKGAKELKLGPMIFTAGSQHIYERNFKDIESCLEHDVFIDYPPIFNKIQRPEKFIECLGYLKDSKDSIEEKMELL